MTQPLIGGISKNQTWLESLQSKYSKIDKAAIANKLLKGSVNIGEAIVNPLGNTGIAGFKFHIPEQEQIKFESEITDYYTDSGSAIQDHIVRKPITITMTGLEGDYFYSVNEIEDMLALVTPTLSLVKEFLPQLTAAAKQSISKKYSFADIENANLANNTENVDLDDLSFITFDKFSQGIVNTGYNFNFNAMDLFSIFQSLYKVKSAQTRAYYFFEALWKLEAPFSVETTWKRFDNMVLQNVTPMRDANLDIAQFQATFKQMNFTQTLSETVESVAGRMKQQAAKVANKGVTKGEEVADV